MARQPDKGFYENFLRRDGRLNRLRYFKRLMLLVIIESVIIGVIFAANTNLIGELTQTGNLVTKFVLAVMQIPFVCMMIRRLHDCGRDEKLAYAALVLNALTIIIVDYRMLAEPTTLENILTLISAAIELYAMFCPGTKGTNQYGADPLN